MNQTVEKIHVSLKSMAEGKLDGVNKSVPLFQVDPLIVEIEEGFNARPIDPEHVAAMKESARNGISFPPISVRVDGGRIILVDGHHRITACRELIAEGVEYRRIDCVQFRGNEADRIMMMLTSAQGKALTPLQMGIQYKALLVFGWTAQEISAKVGKGKQHVEDMVRLANSPVAVHEMIQSGAVSSTLAMSVVRDHGDGAGKVLEVAKAKAKATGKTRVTEKVMQSVNPKPTIMEIHAQISAQERERCAVICVAEGADNIAQIIRAIVS